MFGKKERKLFKAVQDDNVRVVFKLLKKGLFSLPADIYSVSPNGNNALQETIIQKKINILKLFLNEGADIRKKDSKNKSAFEYAISMGDSKIIKEIIKFDIIDDINDNFDRIPPLFLSLLAKDEFYLKHLVNTCKLNQKFENKSIIHFALEMKCKWFQKEWLKYFLNKSKIDLNDKNNYFETVPLYHAASLNNHEIIDVLLKNGSDLYLETIGGSNVLYYLLEEITNEKAVKVIIDYIKKTGFSKELFKKMFADLIAISRTSSINQDKLVISILKENPKKYKEYFFSLSTGRNDLEIIKIILKNGLNPNLIWENEYSEPILNYIIYNSESIASEMISYQNTKELYDFAYWKMNCLIKKVELFLEFGADPKIVGGINHITALERAIIASNVDIVSVILKYDTEVISIGNPLFWAVNVCSPEIVEILIDHKIDINIKGKCDPFTNLSIFDFLKEMKFRAQGHDLPSDNLVKIEKILSR